MAEKSEGEMPPKVRVNVQAAIDHHEKATGEKLSHYELEKRCNISRNLAKWEKGESLKTVSGVVAVSRVTGFPLDKLIETL